MVQRFTYKIIRFDDEEGIFDHVKLGDPWIDEERTYEKKLECNWLARQAMLDELGVDGWEVVSMKTSFGGWGGEKGRIFLRRETLNREALKKLVGELLGEIHEEG